MPLFRAAPARAFVRRHTELREPAGVAGVRLHLANDVLAVWHACQLELGDEDAALPYWSAAWAGGLALSRWLREQPQAVTGKRVLDFGAGSGLVGIVAMQEGASSVRAVDIDPFAIAAIQLNARANDVRIEPVRRDILNDGPPPNVDVVLVADCWYEETLAARVTPWLHRVAEAGIDVLVGDPGRRYLPGAELEELARYAVRTTTELEDLGQQSAAVYRLRQG